MEHTEQGSEYGPGCVGFYHSLIQRMFYVLPDDNRSFVFCLFDLLHESLVCSVDVQGGAGFMLVLRLPAELVGAERTEELLNSAAATPASQRRLNGR